MPEAVAAYVRDSLAENTRRAYQSDLRHFEAWGGSLPASPETVAAYLAAHADGLSVTTLIRRLAALSKAHQARGLSNPIRSELVRATLRGIKRNRRRTQLQAKPLLRDDLLLVLDAMGTGLKDLRDRALLLIGFGAALRRSELVALDVADVEHLRRGIVLHLRRSKTDQDGQGHNIAIPHGRSRWCPIACLDAWLSASGITENAIFRPVDRHGRVHNARLAADLAATLSEAFPRFARSCPSNLGIAWLGERRGSAAMVAAADALQPVVGIAILVLRIPGIVTGLAGGSYIGAAAIACWGAADVLVGRLQDVVRKYFTRSKPAAPYD